MNHVYVYSGTIVTADKAVPVDGQMWRDDGQALSEADMISRSMADARNTGHVHGPADMRNFLYTDMGVLSDPDTEDRT